ncbi:hypothetical protein QAD02_011606 [Eretmocerus hayati]|uniref:Uncharacterized protein n=1 Tax=Eretmocerus hayati TaxID=131215 RepID=A0ACC2NWX0_9HYME|nr:hypothetical protein QAD02_011606 [Eretmocerus hayati]
MTLDKEKELIKKSLKSFKKLKGIDDFLNSPLPYRFSKLIPCISMKSSNAEELRFQGNDLFNKNGHDTCVHFAILEKYNQSIAFSPLKSETLALAYGNKSAILEHIRQYKESILSIDRAVKITMSAPLKVKLHCRKAKCMMALGLPDFNKNLELAKFWLGKIFAEEKIYKDLTDLINQTKTFIEKFESLKTDEKFAEMFGSLTTREEEPKVPSAVEIAYSEEFGKHLIASRDIKPGEILVMEKTFNSAPFTGLSYLYCWHCNSFLWDTIPCDGCALSLFCSEQCKTESWEKYHSIECKVVSTIFITYRYISSSCSTFMTTESSVFKSPGMRIFFSALKQSEDVNKLQATLESFDNSEDREKILKKLPIDDYRQFYALSSMVRGSDLDAIVKDCALCLIILAKSTSVFEKIFESSDFNVKKLLNNNDILFMGALLLKFCVVADFHGFPNRRKPHCQREGNPCKSIGCGWISWSLDLKSSLLIRRTCIPNAIRCMMKSNQMILYSILPIKKGAQIFGSILNIFDGATKIQRQQVYEQQYGSPCDCRACTENWPVVDYAENYYEEV